MRAGDSGAVPRLVGDKVESNGFFRTKLWCSGEVCLGERCFCWAGTGRCVSNGGWVCSAPGECRTKAAVLCRRSREDRNMFPPRIPTMCSI